ncbi:prefoldin subunit alpha [Candidatus Woesearchaeota archaeon]|jgi:prefoldin alpha subunit|nr:prefoldin subunit alpha [Candidatus Woesearchaeota archaeon]MBT5739878.1 prefoldin subunit alpha [Candidatus Woesearchaeota archaeon]
MSDDEIIREKFMEFQAIQQQLEQLQEQLNQVQQQLAELSISKSAVEELTSIEKGTEILTPIANGVFVKASLQNNDKLIVNVGSGVTVERNPTEVVKLLAEQEVGLQDQLVQGQRFMEELNMKAQRIYEEVEQDVQEVKE